MPVPLRTTEWGDPAALSLMLSVAVREPTAAGVNVTLIRHDPFWSRDAGQLLVWLKSAAFAPVIEIEFIASEPEPVLVMVTGC
jgi:hypothetical protein